MGDTTKADKAPTGAVKEPSRKFFLWFLLIQLVPVLGMPTMPGINRVWVLIVLANTCVFLFTLGRYHARSRDTHVKSNRLMLFIGGAMFAAMTVSWGVWMAIAIYQSRSLGM